MATLATHWYISLLGGLRAEQNQQSLTRFRTQKTGALLAYLAYFSEGLHPRDVLADMFWPEDAPDDARASLRTALNSLRKQLEPPGAPAQSVFITDRSHVQLRREAVTTDVRLFNAALQEARQTSEVSEKSRHLARAVQIYRGELLPGFYDDWALQARRHLEEAYAGALRQLRVYTEGAGDLTQALDYALRMVALDPISEEAHVDTIRLFRKAGRAKEALQQYDALARILRDQLDVEPAEESRLLAASIRETLVRPVTMRRSHRHVRTPLPDRTERSVLRKSRSLPPASIPLPIMPFFGREPELARLVELLQPEVKTLSPAAQPSGHRVRLLTLLGPGGSGKTRLAIEVARQCQSAFAEAVWFVPLADLSEPQAIPDAILDVMELSRNVGAPWFAAIRKALRERNGLLILDNFEHLAEGGVSYVRDLLTHLPGLSCLTTSRVKLDLEGERVYAVAPLPVPGQAETSPEKLSEYAGIRLFLDRAQAARVDFQLTAQNSAAVAELCRRLEGLPLALELAASWAQILTPRQMLERTHNPLSLSTRRKREEGRRHESLRATVEWSYRLLSPEQQRLFCLLSVFRGGWNLAAASAICSEEIQTSGEDTLNEEALLRDLTLLTESSLIFTKEVTLESGPEIRFLMLETLREYGMELLSAEEKQRLSERHAVYFLDLVEAYGEEFHVKNRDRLDPDLDNLRTALRRYAADPALGERALRMTVAMYWLWQWWEHYAEGREWIERCLEYAPPDSLLLAEALNVVGSLCYYMNDGEASLAYQQKHLEVRRTLHDELGIARAFCNMGISLHILGRYAEAKPLTEESYAMFRRLKADRYVPAGLLNMARSVVGVGEHERGRALLREALRECEQVGHRVGVGLCYQELGLQAKQLGDLSMARAMLAKALDVFRAVGASNAEGALNDLMAVEEALRADKSREI